MRLYCLVAQEPFAFGSVIPPGSGGTTVRLLHRRHYSVKQTWVDSLSIRSAHILIYLDCIPAGELADPGDADTLKVAQHRRANVDKLGKVRA